MLMAANQSRKAQPINIVKGRRGKVSIINCLLTALSAADRGNSWPSYTFEVLAERVSALRGSIVPVPTVRSVIYRSELFEPGPNQDSRVTWRLNSTGREIVRQHTVRRDE